MLAFYNVQPRLSSIKATTISDPVAGINPIDSSYVNLQNMRGQLQLTIGQGDNPPSVTSSCFVTGGFGEYPDSPYRNWSMDTINTENCTVSAGTFPNSFLVSCQLQATPRTYEIVFSEVLSMNPLIRVINPPIGNNSVTITLSKMRKVEGF